MAKHSSRDVPGRVKFRVIEFELDGSDTALQDAIKGLSTALAGSRAQTPVKRLTSGNGALPSAVVEDSINADGAEEETQDGVSEAPETSRPRTTGKPRAVARPKVIDLDLTSGDLPLKAFLEQENPTNDSRRYLMIAYWLKHQRQITSIGTNHIYTAYRSMGWNNIPADPLLPFRNMRTQGWFDLGEKRGEYTLNHVGEGKVGNQK